MKSREYAIQIVWSNEDGAYLATCFELAGCMADGLTPEEALANLRTVIQEWIEVAKDLGRKIPSPMSAEDFARLAERQQEELRQHIAKSVNHVVQELIMKAMSHSAERCGHGFQQLGISRIRFAEQPCER